MTLSIKTLTIIRDEILRDYRSLLPDAVVASDSDVYARASAVASALDGVYSYLLWQKKQMFADTADSDMLDRHAAQRGLSRKAASRASGSVTVMGTAGAVLASGVALTDANGLAFVVTADIEIGAGGTAVAAIRAVATGADSNLAAGTVLTLSGAASGITVVTKSTSASGRKAMPSGAVQAILPSTMPNSDSLEASTCRCMAVRIRSSALVNFSPVVGSTPCSAKTRSSSTPRLR